MKPVKVITYGRSSQNEKSFPTDPKMSRVHCQIIKYDNGMYQIIDFGSANGTWVNGRCIQKSVPQTLQSTDVVRIGETTLRWMDDFTGAVNYGGAHMADGNYGGAHVAGGNYGGGYDAGGVSVGGGKKSGQLSPLILICGLLSIGLVLTIIIIYAAEGGFRIIEAFPLFLKHYGTGIWIAMVAGIITGVAADFANSYNETDDGMSKAGMIMANIGLSLSVIFLVLGLIADELY